jgi:hypothetical protein
MARDKELIEKRDADIRKEYERMRAMRIGRRPKHTVEFILWTIHERYYLSIRQVERIVYSKG